MKLIEIPESAPWETFQTAQPWPQFTQSWAWGEFRRGRGFQIRRFALIDDVGKWICAAQMELRPKPLVGGYWFAPRGPVFSSHLDEEGLRRALAQFIEALRQKSLARTLFWRFEPPVELGRPEGLLTLDFRRNDPQNPASTILLDLAPDQDQLLAAMHQKTRYNIRVAARHGVTTRLATHPDDVKIFLDLMEETARRDGFATFGREYLKETYETLQRAGLARLRLAVLGDRILSVNMEIIYGGVVTYLHGASSSAARQAMAPYALHWDAIAQAKRDGCRFYDFWGANPLSKAAFAYKSSWEGITRFKQGWGGHQVDLYGTWDVPFFLPLYRVLFLRHALRG